MSIAEAPDRFTRQGDTVPQDKIQTATPFIAGVGAIGRQVAMQLAAIGCPRVVLFDFDDVDHSNVTTQMYRAASVGMPKVEAMRQDLAYYLNDSIEVVANKGRFGARDFWRSEDPVVFSCVDTMDGRVTVGESCRDFGVSMLVDGRMAGESMRIVTVDDGDWDRYFGTLVSDAQCVQGRCTSASTVFAASLAASLMVHEYTRYLRGIRANQDTLLDLLSGLWMPTP